MYSTAIAGEVRLQQHLTTSSAFAADSGWEFSWDYREAGCVGTAWFGRTEPARPVIVVIGPVVDTTGLAPMERFFHPAARAW